MAAILQTAVLLAPGRQEFLIDSPPEKHAGSKLTLDTSLWLGGTATIEIFYSYDGGLTFPVGVSALIDSAVKAPHLFVGRLHTAEQQAIDESNGVPEGERGFVTPTHARAAIIFGGLAAVSTQVNLGWV